jgi:hypothetical protein
MIYSVVPWNHLQVWYQVNYAVSVIISVYFYKKLELPLQVKIGNTLFAIWILGMHLLILNMPLTSMSDDCLGDNQST